MKHGKGIRGMSKADVAAFRKAELAERKRDKRHKQTKKYKRAKRRWERFNEVKQQKLERGQRAKRVGVKYSRGPRVQVEVSRTKTKRGFVEKRVTRFRGLEKVRAAADIARLSPRGSRVYVQLGPGYGAKADWVGSRLNTPAEASIWLQGTGSGYQKKIWRRHDKTKIWIEVVSYRRVGKTVGRNARMENSPGRNGNTGNRKSRIGAVEAQPKKRRAASSTLRKVPKRKARSGRAR